MGTLIECNDTLQITSEQGWPEELKLEEHLKDPYRLEDFSGKTFEFHGKEGIRIYHAPTISEAVMKGRTFLAENREGKWIYWGHCNVLEETHDLVNKTTSGKFTLRHLFSPEEIRIAHDLIDRNPETKPDNSIFLL